MTIICKLVFVYCVCGVKAITSKGKLSVSLKNESFISICIIIKSEAMVKNFRFWSHLGEGGNIDLMDLRKDVALHKIWLIWYDIYFRVPNVA